MANYPQISEARQLPAADRQVVELVGIYRKAMTPLGKMGDDDEAFVGYVVIELTGKCSDYEPTAWDGEPPAVQLGLDKRPDDEVSRLADKRVRVVGKLVMDPNVARDPEEAMMDAEPALIEFEGLQLAP